MINPLLIEQGYISVQHHPMLDLLIYNYTNKTQYEGLWNETTLMCRGLILNTAGEIIARPFKKFFNYSELDGKVPNEPFRVFTKYDGSLGILYWNEDTPCIATRGSFTSDQALVASDILIGKYEHIIPKLDKSLTYCFEILYPENRVVVDYGSRRDLILLAVIETATGKDLPLPDIGFPLAEEHHGISDLKYLKGLEWDNAEGFVCLFNSGVRVKLKMSEYLRLHRIVTCISSLDIWETLKSGGNLDEIIDRVPDEFLGWVQSTEYELLSQYNKIERLCLDIYKSCPQGDRKQVANYFIKHPVKAILFAMLDGKNYKDIIWRTIRPAHEKPFSNEYRRTKI